MRGLGVALRFWIGQPTPQKFLNRMQRIKDVCGHSICNFTT
jgi:hypothetical protein